MSKKVNETLALNQALYQFQEDRKIDVVVRQANKNRVKYWIYSDDREKTRAEVYASLKKYKVGKIEDIIDNDSSMPGIQCIQKDGFKIQFIFKPTKGGMNQTTLNSSVTELFPCIAFNNGISPTGTVDSFYRQIREANGNTQKKGGAYLTDKDAKAGSNFIQKADPKSNSILQTKVRNAMNVTRWLLAHNRYHPIEEAYWGYRAKPRGVPSNHPGDIFIRYKESGELLGISLKAGGKKTDEPKFNSYVKPIFEQFGKTQQYEDIKKKLWPQYLQVPGVDQSDFKNWGKRPLAMKTYQLEKDDEDEYNRLYDINLGIIKDSLINLFNSNPKDARQWMKENIANIGFDVPVVLVKATERSASQDKSGNLLVTALQATEPKKIDARYPKTGKSKQAFEILLKDGSEIQLDFTTRTNKVGAMHKMGQFTNLAVKFNKVKKV